MTDRAPKTSSAANNFFIIFVDAIFTTSFERLFTKSFEGANANAWSPCVYPRRITD
jgi:hypothetical protein